MVLTGYPPRFGFVVEVGGSGRHLVLLPFLFVAVALASPSPFPIHLYRRVHVPIFGSAVTVIDNLTLPSWPESTSTATRDTPS